VPDDERDDERDENPERSPAVGDALGILVQAIVRRGRSGLERFAHQGRLRMELRQLKRDRDTMLQKLGREAKALLEGGEIDHPGLRRGAQRIDELDASIAALAERAASTDEARFGEE
jgi:hypothetical protein